MELIATQSNASFHHVAIDITNDDTLFTFFSYICKCVIYKASCWIVMIFTLGKPKVDSMMKTEHFKALAKNDNSSAIANHIN